MEKCIRLQMDELLVIMGVKRQKNGRQVGKCRGDRQVKGKNRRERRGEG